MNSFLLAIRLAIRNVGAYGVKNLIVGAILMFGTAVVVSGAALIDSLDVAMRKSITTSVTGDLQIYAKDARDPLALLGDSNFGGSDYGEMGDAKPVIEALKGVPEVAAVLPMGIANATVFGANDIDRTLEELRAAVKAEDSAREQSLLERIRRIASDIEPELDRVAVITSDDTTVSDNRAALARVRSDEFAAEYAADPIAAIDWMDGHVAPLATDGRLAYFQLLGTDLDQFYTTFERFEITKGERVPSGQRGIILEETMVEQWIKNNLAREFDAIHESVVEDGETIGTGGTLYEKVQRNSRQYRRILYQLDPAEADALSPKLQAELKSTDTDLAVLLKSFLAVTDENLGERYDFFYKEIAPLIRLYDIYVGDTLPLRAFTKSGYLKSINVKVYGIYRYKGVTNGESAAGTFCMVDMLTFRDLYGKMTDSQQAELSAIKASVGAKDVSSEDAEAALFGGGGSIEQVVDSTTASTSGLGDLTSVSFGRADDRVTQSYTHDDVENGLALNAAVILKDPSQNDAGKVAVQAALDKAGLPLQVIDWKAASGMLGQFVTVVQLILIIAVGVMFLVAMVIINNALVMATMERTSEIGTMRAVGAQRGFVISIFVLETLIVGLIAGAAGSGLSVGLIGYLHDVGIPAGADFLTIVFGGERLYPTMNAGSIEIGMTLVAVVSTLATLYPAVLAASVPPVVALGGKE